MLGGPPKIVKLNTPATPVSLGDARKLSKFESGTIGAVGWISKPALRLLISLFGGYLASPLVKPFVPLPKFAVASPENEAARKRMEAVAVLLNKSTARQTEIAKKLLGETLGGTFVGQKVLGAPLELLERKFSSKEEETKYLWQLRKEYYELAVPAVVREGINWTLDWTLFVTGFITLLVFSNPISNSIVESIKRSVREKRLTMGINENNEDIEDRLNSLTADIHIINENQSKILSILSAGGLSVDDLKLNSPDSYNPEHIQSIIKRLILSGSEISEEQRLKLVEALKIIQEKFASVTEIIKNLEGAEDVGKSE